MIRLHIRLLVFQVTAVSMSSQKKLTSKISDLQLFEFSITNSSPFPMWCWFRNYAEKDSQVTILHLKDNIYIKIRNKKGTQKRFSYEELRYSGTELTLPNTSDFCYTSPPLSLKQINTKELGSKWGSHPISNTNFRKINASPIF